MYHKINIGGQAERYKYDECQNCRQEKGSKKGKSYTGKETRRDGTK